MTGRFNLKVVATLLALTLWFYVNFVVSPIQKRTVKVPVDFRNAPANLLVSPPQATVEVGLSGSRREFILAGPEKVQASVDLYNLRPGKAYFGIRTTPHPGLNVDFTRPAQIEFTGQALKTQEFPVEVELKGAPAEGFMAEKPVIVPEKVRVEAPADVMERIKACKVQIMLGEVKNSVSERRKVFAMLANGEPTAQATIHPESISVDVPIKAGYPTREFSVKPQFLNKLPEGFRLEGFTVSPATLTVTAPARVLDDMRELLTAPIDLSSVQTGGNIIQLVTPPFENTRIVGSGTVSVNLVLNRMEITKSFSGIPLRLRNAPQHHCTVVPSSYTMVLEGYAEKLKGVAPSDLEVVLDVRDKKPGRLEVPLSCPTGLPDGVKILDILPAKVQIEISESQTASESVSP